MGKTLKRFGAKRQGENDGSDSCFFASIRGYIYLIANNQILMGFGCDSAALRQSVLSVFEIHEREFLISRSAATNTKNTTAITPFIVKNAAFNLLRSSEATSECS